MGAYADFHRRSIEDRDGFWSEQAQLIDWKTRPTQICDYNKPPFAKWFVGGTTNLCHRQTIWQKADCCSRRSGWAAFSSQSAAPVRTRSRPGLQ